MPLSREDSIVVLQEFRHLLREYDPEAYETVLQSMEGMQDHRMMLIGFVDALKNYYAMRSVGRYRETLERINRNIECEDGGRIQEITIALSPVDREIYRIPEINLAALPDHASSIQDYTELILSLEELISEIRNEQRTNGDGQ